MRSDTSKAKVFRPCDPGSGTESPRPDGLADAVLALKIAIPNKVQILSKFSSEPVSLGDHLRRRRLELGLYQKDVAATIGVTASSIWNWEHGWTIDWRYLPRLIVFIGYNPILCPDDVTNVCLALGSKATCSIWR